MTEAIDVPAEHLFSAALATAVRLLAAQSGMLAPFAHALDANGRLLFFGKYESEIELRIDRAIDALFAHLRRLTIRGAAVVYAGRDTDTGRAMLCIEIETLDSAPERIFVPYVIGMPLLRKPKVTTYAPIRTPGTARIFAG